MPEIHHFNQTVFAAYAIVDEIRIVPQASDILAFTIGRSQFWELRKQFCAFEQTHCKNLGSLRVVGCDVPNDVFESRNCSRREDYFVSHRPGISRTRSTGTPRPASSSVAALSSEASKAASSLSDIRG